MMRISNSRMLVYGWAFTLAGTLSADTKTDEPFDSPTNTLQEIVTESPTNKEALNVVPSADKTTTSKPEDTDKIRSQSRDTPGDSLNDRAADLTADLTTENQPSGDIEDTASTAPLSSAQLAFSEQELERRDLIRKCLSYYFQQKENTSTRSPWGLMHALIAFGVDTEFISRGKEVNAAGYLCWNGSGRGQRLFSIRKGQIHTPIGPGFQGHEGQFLAILAQSRVQKDYPLRISGKRLTVQDLIEHEQRTCRPKSELTFKLIGLSHYLPINATWECNNGSQWDLERIIKEELAQPVVGAACGGTHRMMGFTYAVQKRIRKGGEITGQWERAEKFVSEFVDYTLELQNSDGSFSTKWFEGRGNENSKARKLQTTGHLVEWLVATLPPERLREQDIAQAVDFLAKLMWKDRRMKWEVGPKGHAVRALALYDERVFGSKPGSRDEMLAGIKGKNSNRLRR